MLTVFDFFLFFHPASVPQKTLIDFSIERITSIPGLNFSCSDKYSESDLDRKSVVEGKSLDIGGGGVI